MVEPRWQPRAAGSPLAHLQPRPGAEHVSEPIEWLSTDDGLRAAENLERLAADVELVNDMRRDDYSGRAYDVIAGALVQYGVGVLTGWCLTGRIFEKVAEINRPVKRPPFGTMTKTEALSLAGETVAASLGPFVDDVLRPGVWDPKKGASIATFFVGSCKRQFPNVYRRWLGEQQHAINVGDELHLFDRPTAGDSIEDDVLTELAGATALSLVKNLDARKALVLTSAGYSQPEIADKLGTTTKAVEMMLRYARQQVRRRSREA